MKHLFVLFAVLALACGGRVSRDNEASPEEYADLVSNETGGSSSADSLPESVGEAGSPALEEISVEEGGSADLVEDPSGEAGRPSNTGGSPATGGTSSTGGTPTIATGGSATTLTGGNDSVAVGDNAGTSSDSENGGSDFVIIPVENGGEGGSAGIGNQAGAGHAAIGGSAGSEACVPSIVVRSLTHTDAVIPAGSRDVVIATFEIETDCDVDVSRIDMVLTTPDVANTDAWPYCTALCAEASDWFFSDLKLVDAQSGSVLMGPNAFGDHTSNSHAVTSLADSWTIRAGEPRQFYATMDVRADLPSEVIGLRYGLFVGSLGLDLVELGGVWTWTHENNSFGTYFTLGEEEEFSFCGSLPEGCCTTTSFPRDYDTPLAGMLIKAEGSPAVSYMGSDGKRYVFPSRTELASWFSFWNVENPVEDPEVCQTVREFADDVVSDIPIGGTVKIRPGTYMVTISSDPSVYVVSRHGTLRFIGVYFPDTSATPYGCWGTIPSSGAMPCWTIAEEVGALAYELFENPNEFVRVVPDVYFLDYLIGEDLTGGQGPIPGATPYDPDLEYDWGSPATIERELGIIE